MSPKLPPEQRGIEHIAPPTPAQLNEEKFVQALQAQERARYKNVSPAGWGGGVMSNNESPGWFT